MVSFKGVNGILNVLIAALTDISTSKATFILVSKNLVYNTLDEAGLIGKPK